VQVGILGGTGPAGRGLAVRLANAGIPVVIGSRDAERAREVVAETVGAWPDRSLEIIGADNAGAAAADVVVVATPWDSASATVRPLRQDLAGKVVISMVIALLKSGREMLPLFVPRGSMAAELQATLPESRVAASFHHLPAADLLDLDTVLGADVLACSDDPEATVVTLGLIAAIDGLTPYDAGSLAQAAAIEAFTATFITINIRHKAHTTLRLAGI
jgi:NADPH-dependent F420 reductase